MFCSSPALLKGAIAQLRHRHAQTNPPNPPNPPNSQKPTDFDALACHIQIAIKSHDPDGTGKVPLFRTIDEFQKTTQCPYPSYNYISSSSELDVLSILNCHNGQRKLTMSVLEFLTVSLTHLKVPQSDVLIIYAGASGLASVIAANIFKQVQFVLYDPAPNTVALLPPFQDKVVYRTPPQQVDLSKRMIIFTEIGRAHV